MLLGEIHMSDDLVKRLRKRAMDDRAIQANNEVVAAALKGQRLLFDQGVKSDSNRFAVRLSLDYEGSAKNDAKLAADWDSAADRIEALTAALTAVVDEYEMQMHGPALHSIEAANAILNTGGADK